MDKNYNLLAAATDDKVRLDMTLTKIVQRTGKKLTEICETLVGDGKNIPQGLGKVGPGDGIATFVLDKTVGRIPGIRLFGVTHDATGNWFTATKVASGFADGDGYAPREYGKLPGMSKSFCGTGLLPGALKGLVGTQFAHGSMPQIVGLATF